MNAPEPKTHEVLQVPNYLPMQRSIVIWPAPILSQPTKTVEVFDRELWKLLEDLKATSTRARGLGLAAPQIGVPLRVAVAVSGYGTKSAAYVELINPIILVREDEFLSKDEGCLSIPQVRFNVPRHRRVLFSYQDRFGASYTHWDDGLFALEVQHECDHLEGKTVAEYANSVKRASAMQKMKAFKRRGYPWPLVKTDANGNEIEVKE